MAIVKGKQRQRLEAYLAGADEEQMRASGRDWRAKATSLSGLAGRLKSTGLSPAQPCVASCAASRPRS